MLFKKTAGKRRLSLQNLLQSDPTSRLLGGIQPNYPLVHCWKEIVIGYSRGGFDLLIEMNCSFCQGSKDTWYMGALVVLSRQRWRQQRKENKQQRAGSRENVFPVRMKLCFFLMKEVDRERESGGQYSDWIILNILQFVLFFLMTECVRDVHTDKS